jgi:negative regulator of sigma E activity
MNDSTDEQLSALADDELPADKLAEMLARMEQDHALSDRLGRYAMIRASLQRSLPDTVDTALASRVTAAIRQEPAHTGPSRPAADQARPSNRTSTPAAGNGPVRQLDAKRWTGPLAGFAITASVAMLAVMLWPGQQTAPEPSASAPIAQVSPAGEQRSIQGVQTVSSENIRWDRLDPDVQSRLNGYAISHGDQSVGRQLGIVPRHVGSTGRDPEQ